MELTDRAFPVVRLFDPNANPSYFTARGGIWETGAAYWEIATLLVAIICAVFLAVALRQRSRPGAFIARLCLTPLLFGCLATVIQVHQLFIGAARVWIGPSASFEESTYWTLYSTHLGFYSSIILSLLFGVIHWRTAPPSRSTLLAQAALAGAFLVIAAAAFEPQLRYACDDVRLWAAERHVRAAGPDMETADFLEQMGERTLPKRASLAASCAPYLDARDPVKACAALEIFWTLRTASRPVPGTPPSKETTRFIAYLDKLVLDSFPRWQLFRNSNSYRDISLYLSLLPPVDSKPRLKEIASQASSNGQALICIAWQRDPADMEFLLPFMLANSFDASSLPYHFRKSYGDAAIPYLQRAQREAQTGSTRKAAQEELEKLAAQPEA